MVTAGVVTTHGSLSGRSPDRAADPERHTWEHSGDQSGPLGAGAEQTEPTPHLQSQQEAPVPSDPGACTPASAATRESTHWAAAEDKARDQSVHRWEGPHPSGA